MCLWSFEKYHHSTQQPISFTALLFLFYFSHDSIISSVLVNVLLSSWQCAIIYCFQLKAYMVLVLSWVRIISLLNSIKLIFNFTEQCWSIQSLKIIKLHFAKRRKHNKLNKTFVCYRRCGNLLLLCIYGESFVKSVKSYDFESTQWTSTSLTQKSSFLYFSNFRIELRS